MLCNGGGLSQIPDDLPSGVEHLSLVKNNIRVLKTDAFQRYKSLRKLYLDGNAISHVQQFAFRGLGRLQELSMQNTPLDRLGPFTFSGLHNLTHLYLSHNHIRRIESYAFAGTSSIRLLVLTGNPTVRIDSSAFAGIQISLFLFFTLSVVGSINDSLSPVSWLIVTIEYGWPAPLPFMSSINLAVHHYSFITIKRFGGEKKGSRKGWASLIVQGRI